MGLASGLANLARTLIGKEGQTATLQRTGPDDPGQTFRCTKIEKPSHLPRSYRGDIKDMPDQEPVRFLVAVPKPLPSPYTTPLDWINALIPRHTKFAVGGIQYTVMRIIETAPEDVTVTFTLVCNT